MFNKNQFQADAYIINTVKPKPKFSFNFLVKKFAVFKVELAKGSN